MSTAKVIFTYKRKRLSSCSGVGHADGCPDFSSDVPTGKRQHATNERSEMLKKDIKIFRCINCNEADLSVNCKSCLNAYNNGHADSHHEVCQGENLSSACSSPRVHGSSIFKEDNHVERSDAINTRDTMLSCHELAVDHPFATLGRNITSGAPLVKAINPSQKDSFLDLNSSSPHEDGCIQGGLVSQSAEKTTDSLQKQSYQSKSEIAKAKLTTPLLTFSRRLKRKADAGGQDVNSKPPAREGAYAVKDSESMRISSCSCEITADKSRQVEGSVDFKVASSDADIRNVLCQGEAEMISNGIGDSPCSCTRSCADTAILKYTMGGKCSGEALIVDSLAIAKQTVTKSSGSSASPAADVTTNFSKENVECLSNVGIAVSSGDDTCITEKLPASNQLRRASSGDSQLTSSDGSDSKMAAGKTAEQKASSGVFLFDCNVIPEYNLEEQASDVVHLGMAKNCRNLMQEGYLESKSLDLFQGTGVQAMDSHHMQSSKGACTAAEAESKPTSKWLQLFLDDGKSCPSPPANANSEIGCCKAERHAKFALDGKKDWLEQSSSRASALLGLSMPIEPVLGQTSKHGSGVQPSDANSKTKEFIQTLAAPQFPDHASFILRHKILLETTNTKAAALRGNRNISLDKFEPCPIMWSEEELDSLWIGIRRHGRGNWHAMLLDPRLRFAPWRTARDLADQWEQEQYKLLSGPHMPQGRYSNPAHPCNLDCSGSFTCPRSRIMRESISAETQLSLGDVYAPKVGGYHRSSAQSYRDTPSHKHAKMAGCGLFNNLQNNVMVGSDRSPDGLAIGLAVNNHWLREPVGAFSRSSEPTLPTISALSQVGVPRGVHAFAEPSSGTSCGPRNLAMTAEVQPSRGIQYDRPSMRKRGVTNNLIIIDSSDASSEETISDDHNIKR